MDLEVEASLSIPDVTYVDNSFYWVFKMSQSGTSGSAVFPTGTVVLRVDLPEGIVADEVRMSSAQLIRGKLVETGSGRIIIRNLRVSILFWLDTTAL